MSLESKSANETKESLVDGMEVNKSQNTKTTKRKTNETIDKEITPELSNLPILVAGVNSSKFDVQFSSTATLRKILADISPPIDEVIASGVVPRLVEFLNFVDYPQLQFEAAWSLTNISSGSHDQTRVVIDAGAAPILVKLLNSPNEEIREQAVWALGNIAGDSPQSRDYVLQLNALKPLLNQFKDSSRPSMFRNATWALSNFCRGRPPPLFDLIRSTLPTLAKLLYSDNKDVLIDACRALSYLSDGSNERIQSVVEAGVCKRLVELMMHTNINIQTAALRVIGNIAIGDELQTQMLINTSALPCLLTLIGRPNRGIRKEACWTISNITAGSKAQIAAVIDAGIIPPLVQLLIHDEFDIKKEVACAITNAISGGSPEQIKYLVTRGCLKPLCDLLSVSDNDVVSVALEGLENILKIGEYDAKFSPNTSGVNIYVKRIEQADGLDKIETLQLHYDQDIYQKAVSIMETYFVVKEGTDKVLTNIDVT